MNDDAMKPAECAYHGRSDCKACTSLRIAIKAEDAGKQSLAETGFRRALEHEQVGL